MHFKMSSAICLSLDQSKILSSGDGLTKAMHWHNVKIPTCTIESNKLLSCLKLVSSSSPSFTKLLMQTSRQVHKFTCDVFVGKKNLMIKR